MWNYPDNITGNEREIAGDPAGVTAACNNLTEANRIHAAMMALYDAVDSIDEELAMELEALAARIYEKADNAVERAVEGSWAEEE